jgi:signal transduction histidine kinase
LSSAGFSIIRFFPTQPSTSGHQVAACYPALRRIGKRANRSMNHSGFTKYEPMLAILAALRKNGTSDVFRGVGVSGGMEAQVLNGMSLPGPLNRQSITLVAGGVSLLLGLLVILGWHTGNHALVQLHPTFVPMQYNTALGFLVSGAGVLLLAAGLKMQAAVAGLVVAAIGVATGSQYLFGLHLGIDELLMNHDVTVGTSNPGRMAPNTALCFMITGSVLAGLPVLRNDRAKGFALRMAGLALLALSAVAMLGYVSGVESAYGWANLTRMALHTALGFLAIGIGLVARSGVSEGAGKGEISPFWFSGCTLAVCILASMAIWQNMRQHEVQWQQKVTADAVELVVSKIGLELADVVSALRRMGYRWNIDDGSDAAEWVHVANQYVANFDSLSQLHWLSSSSSTIRSSLAAQPDPALIERIREHIQSTRWAETEDLTFDQSTLLVEPQVSNSSILAIVLPTYANDRQDGYLVGMISVPLLLEAGWVARILNDLDHRVIVASRQITGSDASDAEWGSAIASSFDVAGTSIEVAALHARLDDSQPGYSAGLILSIGFLFSLIAATSIHLAVTNGRAKLRLGLINQQLAQHSFSLKKSNTDLERSNQQLDEFAYIASHDLKEPLRAISNHSRYLLEDYEDQFQEDGVKRINRMIFLCERLDQLIGDLLHFSRLGRQEQARRSTDLNEVVRDVENVFDETLVDANARVVVVDPLPTIVCDAERVAELFRNLIGNAIKYNENDEKLVEVGLSGDGGNIIFVRDNGIGIEMEHHDDIFRIFKRLHSQSRYGGGTGAGLTFVKKIVEEHGGHIWLESAPDTGTTFFFTLERGLA